jgi:beta-apo-4'-carotenal oxygenase
MENVTSGGATCNDTFMHCQIPAAPIGGVGSSGTGNYHGYYSFKAFSHQRAIAKTPYWAEKLLRVRYMPYVQSELDRFHATTDAKPDFDRNGQVIKGLGYWVGLIFGLGGKTTTRSAFRWAVLIVIATFLGLKRSSLGL